MLSTFEFFLVLLLLYWLLRCADFFGFFFLRVASCSALIYALGSANTYVVEEPVALSSPSSIAKKRRPEVVV